MTIRYSTESGFYRGIAECVKNGLTFDADGDKFIIKLLGGY